MKRDYILAQRTFLLLQSLIAKIEAVRADAATESSRLVGLVNSSRAGRLGLLRRAVLAQNGCICLALRPRTAADLR